ncbi:hypothetical protein BY458DRAFT_523566 [Sporodiniella umbellata]|nr:hypothetical protein BY458DRAFT_523566 [Sporodiniella umbellata]
MDDLLDLSWSSKPTTINKTEKKDAFASLLPTSNNAKPIDNSKLSLLEQQRKQSMNSWSSPTSTNASLKPTLSNSSNTMFAQKPPVTSLTSAKTSGSSTFEDLLNPFATTKKDSNDNRNTPINQLKNPVPVEENKEQWNFDLFAMPSTSELSKEENKKTTQHISSTDVFDFSTSEASAEYDTKSISNAFDEDNPLGILSEPVKIKREEPLEQDNHENPLGVLGEPVSAKEIQFEQKERNSHGSSELEIPPKESLTLGYDPSTAKVDEMLATLIDMGFSLNQSKFAIEATGDLPSAIDLLMQNSEPAQRVPSNQLAQSHWVEDKLQIQTDKIVGQAQELGGMLYKNASSFLKMGREKMTKAVGDWQEQQRTQRLRQLQEQQKGPVRPKWMTDAMKPEGMSEGSSETLEDDEGLQRMRYQQQQQRQKYFEQKESRWANDTEESYVSPSRRKNTSGRSTPVHHSSPGVQTASIPSQHTPRQAAQSAAQAKSLTAAPKERTRPVINLSPEVMNQVNQARSLGNEKFKLGQFGEAEEAYTHAIELLPKGHDHHVLLLNNRAMSSLKTGKYQQCIEDCDNALALSKESGVSTLSEGVRIQWGDQILKSLYRKAEALENIEKYADAVATYEQALKIEGPHPKLNQSMARCRRALKPILPSTPVKVAVRAPVAAKELHSSKAVAEMRAKAAEQEAEEAEKLSKTDEINARLTVWKAGKEQNLRALLATLDTLLWPGAQWKGAQMSDLISVKKCKIVYMKAISKVHPDKLPADATVEQRMLASGIFSSHSE